MQVRRMTGLVLRPVIFYLELHYLSSIKQLYPQTVQVKKRNYHRYRLENKDKVLKKWVRVGDVLGKAVADQQHVFDARLRQVLLGLDPLLHLSQVSTGPDLDQPGRFLITGLDEPILLMALERLKDLL